ncbi:hypothetical protein WG66_001095, partial [Moniliophthora roreri]
MASHSPEMLSVLNTALNHQTTVSEAVSACVLFVYDFLLRLDLEARYVWKSPWSLFKVLYLVQRFLPIVDMCIFLLHLNFATEMSPQDCMVNYSVMFYLAAVGVSLSNLIQTIRIWCAWRKNKLVQIIITALTIGCFVVNIIAVNRVTMSLKFLSILFPTFRGCLITDGKNTYASWIIWLVYDTDQKGGLSEFARIMYQDVLSVINIIVMTTLP